jgi:hypothetical protein
MATRRCNPFGYATDAGPARLVGGVYGPEYAGKLTVNRDGIHGVAVCEQPYTGRYRMACQFGHLGEIMELCDFHARMIQARYSRTCTGCAIPPESRELEENMNWVMRQFSAANERRDLATCARMRSRLNDLRQEMDDLIRRGVIRAAVPLALVEVS